jgi:hypothetical protein
MFRARLHLNLHAVNMHNMSIDSKPYTVHIERIGRNCDVLLQNVGGTRISLALY